MFIFSIKKSSVIASCDVLFRPKLLCRKQYNEDVYKFIKLL